MNRQYWKSLWAEGDTGFHQVSINTHLKNFWPTLDLAAGSRVLVPLCGASEDMQWLVNQGHRVIGVELAQEAIDAFCTRRHETVVRDRLPNFTRYRQGAVTLLQGDFFHLHPRDVAHVACVYDRAALVALPEASRHRYAFHMAQLLRPGAQILLVAREQPASRRSPPFSVTLPHLDALFGVNFHIDCLHRHERDDGVIEPVYRLTRKAPVVRSIYRAHG